MECAEKIVIRWMKVYFNICKFVELLLYHYYVADFTHNGNSKVKDHMFQRKLILSLAYDEALP